MAYSFNLISHNIWLLFLTDLSILLLYWGWCSKIELVDLLAFVQANYLVTFEQLEYVGADFRAKVKPTLSFAYGENKQEKRS